MAEEQICEPCRKLDLSVHPHTDNQTEWWSKRAVILLHGCVDALVPPSSPSFADACCYTQTHMWAAEYLICQMHDCRTHHQLVPFLATMSCFDRPLSFTRQSLGNIVCELVLMHNSRLFFLVKTTPCVIYDAICLCYGEKIVKEHVVICYSKKFNMYTLPLFLLAPQEMFSFPSLPGNIRGHWVAVVRISQNQSIGEKPKTQKQTEILPFL